MSVPKASESDWLKHKPTILQLYTELKSVKKVMQIMATEHGFRASEGQYRAKLHAWEPGKKNMKGADWKAISQYLKHHNLAPTSVKVSLHGRPIPPDRLRKELLRYDTPSLALPAHLRQQMFSCDRPVQNSLPPQLPYGVRLYENIFRLREVRFNIPWQEICRALDEIKLVDTSTRSRAASPMSSNIVSAEGTSDTTMGQYWDDQGIDTFIRNEYGEEHWSVLDSTDGFNVHQNARSNDFIGFHITNVLDVLDPPIASRCSDTCAPPAAWIKPHIPELPKLKFDDHFNELLDPTSEKRMQILMSFMALMLANELLLPKQVDDFVRFLDEAAGNRAFEFLSLRKDISTRAIVCQMMFSAVRLDLRQLLRGALKSGASPNLRSCGLLSKTLIHEAVTWDRLDIIRLLIDAGLQFTATDWMSESISWPGCAVHDNPDMKLYMQRPRNFRKNPASAFYEVPAFYCPCEAGDFHASTFGTALSSRIAKDIMSLLPVSSVAAAPTPVVIEAIRWGFDTEAVRDLIRNGASVSECSPSNSGGSRRLRDHETMLNQTSPLSAAIYSGNIAMVSLLLDLGANPNGPITEEYKKVMEEWSEHLFKPPLLVAVESANLEMVRLLVRHGANPDWSPLEILDKHNRRDLIKKCRSLVECASENNKIRLCAFYPVQAAASLARSDILEFLLENKASTTPSFGLPPWSIASYFSRIAAVNVLIKWGVNVDLTNFESLEISPLEAAVLLKAAYMVKQPISASADLTIRRGETLAKVPNGAECTVICDALSRAGGPFDSATLILREVIRYGNYEHASQLLEQGINPSGDCGDTTSPLVEAIERNDLSLVDLLLLWGVNPNCPGKMSSKLTPFFRYVHDIRPMWQLIDPSIFDAQSISPPHRFEDKEILCTPLHCAAVVGNLAIIAHLYHAGADVNGNLIISKDGKVVELDSNGKVTAVDLAIAAQHKEIVEFLLSKGAKINHSLQWYQEREDSFAYSPLCTMVAQSNQEMVELLLRNGADMNYTCPRKGGRPLPILPLECACLRVDKSLVCFLIKCGADVHMGHALAFLFGNDYSFLVPRKRAEARAEIMEILLSYRIDVNGRYPDMHSPLQGVLEHYGGSDRGGAGQYVSRLIELGAEINSPPAKNSGRTALQFAAGYGDVELVQYLISKGADVNAPAASAAGVTALQAAAIDGYLRIAQILIEHGADIDAEPSAWLGTRAIDGAAERGRIDMVKFLLDNYNGPRSIADICTSAMQCAKEENQWYVMELLENYKHPTEN